MATKTTTTVYVVVLEKPGSYDIAVFDTREIAEKYRERCGDSKTSPVYERAVRKR